MNYKEDPIAQNTQWYSLTKSISGATIKILKTSDNQYKTTSSYRNNYIIYPLLVLTLVLGSIFGMGYLTGTPIYFGFKNYVGLCIFLIILSLFLFFFHKLTFKSLLFNFDDKKLYKEGTLLAELNDIYAVQLLSHHHAVSGNYKIRFELNLIKTSGERIYLYNNANYNKTSKQAIILADKLNCQIWDGTKD